MTKKFDEKARTLKISMLFYGFLSYVKRVNWVNKVLKTIVIDTYIFIDRS